MTPDKELKPCDMPKEIWVTRYPYCEWRDDEKQAAHIAKMNNLEGITKYTRADQSPPLPDVVREAREKIAYALKAISDNCPFAYLERYSITPSVNHQNNIKRVCFEIEQLSDTLIRAATQQPEVVTVEDMTMLIQDWKFNEENQQPFFGSYLAKRFPHGIKIVEG